jgi:hypothetical protein
MVYLISVFLFLILGKTFTLELISRKLYKQINNYYFWTRNRFLRDYTRST